MAHNLQLVWKPTILFLEMVQIMLQSHVQSTQHRTTAHLAQTMTLLSLTSEELRQRIENELSTNPALEVLDERRCPNCSRKLSNHDHCSICSQPQTNQSDEPVVFISSREDFNVGTGAIRDDELPDDNFSYQEEDLGMYVLGQIAPDLKHEDRKIAANILSNLDEDGLLDTSTIELARYFHVPISRIEQVQKMIQHADPVGVASSSPQEALLVQLDVLEESRTIPDMARPIIEHHMDLLSRRQDSEIARRLKSGLRKVRQGIQFISENLNPYPARTHWGYNRSNNILQSQLFSRPDIVINYLNDDPNEQLVVEVIMPLRGTLQVNPEFKRAVRQAQEEKKDLWKQDMESASLLIKCIQQRNHTMLRLMQRVVGMQKKYITSGERYLKPVTRARLAGELEVHESTISRAVSGKIVQMPNKKIVPLANFFDRNLNVRSVLKEIIEEETKPSSDSDLAEALAKQGFSVARRTVAKYRAMEGILPAHLRRTAKAI
jgi:RNA polymerase sigma-54 factor